MPKSKLSAFFSLLLVFASGALVGGFVHRLYMVNTVTALKLQQPQRPTPEEARKHQVEEMRQKVGLDDKQISDYNAILDSTRQQFDKLHDKMNAEGHVIHDEQIAKVNAILRPEQRPLYEKWRAEREAERRQREQQKKK